MALLASGKFVPDEISHIMVNDSAVCMHAPVVLSASKKIVSTTRSMNLPSISTEEEKMGQLKLVLQSFLYIVLTFW